MNKPKFIIEKEVNKQNHDEFMLNFELK